MTPTIRARFFQAQGWRIEHPCSPNDYDLYDPKGSKEVQAGTFEDVLDCLPPLTLDAIAEALRKMEPNEVERFNNYCDGCTGLSPFGVLTQNVETLAECVLKAKGVEL